jgi:hypothetical protein
MAPLHRKIFLTFLSKLRFARDYTKCCLGRLALLLAFLASASGRKFSKWWHSRPGKPGTTSQTLKPADPPFLGTEANSYSVSGGPAIVRQYTVAASSVPASASLPSLHERVERQPATVAPIVDARVGTPPALANLPAGHSRGHNPPRPLGGRGFVNRSSGDLSAASIQSRASVRFSIITTSRDSLRATHGQPSPNPVGVHRQFGHDPVNRRSASMGSTQSRASDRFSIITTSHDSVRATYDQPSRLPRATHRQFGRGPDPSRSRERPTRPNTPHDPPRPSPEIITTNLPSLDHEDGRVSPVLQPLASSPYTHPFLNPSPMDEIRREVSLTSFVVDVQNPSTESLPISPSTTNLPITEEPLAMESATAHSSPDSPVVVLVDQHDEPVLGSPTSSNAATLDYYLPEGRFVQLIISDQIPRYEKNALMQVEYTILSPHLYISLQTSRGDTL